MPAVGITPAGFVIPSLSDIEAQIEAQILATVDPQLDLSPATPDGQILGIYANASASVWELAQVVYNAYNRQDVEGAGLDNLGDITGTPREGPDYTQVYATCALAPGSYAASTWDDVTGSLTSATLLCNVAGAQSQQFANVNPVNPVNLSGTVDCVNDATSVTFSVPQNLAIGSLLIFASQPTVAYSLAFAAVAATTVALTSLYSGTTAGATTACPGTVVLMQASTIGATPSVNDGTLTQITTPVSGWVSVDNPPLGTSPTSSNAQAGEAEEADSAYALRQDQDVAGEGACTAVATAAALTKLGAAAEPPINLVIIVLENTTNAPLTVDGYTLPPHTYAPVIWDGGIGWTTSAAGMAAISAVVYANKPPGITSFGTTTVSVSDPFLGTQFVSYTAPTGLPLFISAIVVPRSGVVFASLVSAIQVALVAAAVAPTPAGGIPPNGQLAPGAAVLGSQLESVIMSVPGVLDIQTIAGVRLLTFGFTASPSNTAPILLNATQIATIPLATAATNIIILPGVYP